MAKIKLKVTLVSSSYADLPSEQLNKYNSKRFLHLTDTENNIRLVCDEINERFLRLYSGESDLAIERIQDDDRCDVDPEFEVGEIFLPGDPIRVVVDNALHDVNSTILGKFSSIIENTPSKTKTMEMNNMSQSTPVFLQEPKHTFSGGLPSLKEHISETPRREEILLDSLSPHKNHSNSFQPDGNISDKNYLHRNTSLSRGYALEELDRSSISLPPPEKEDSHIVPTKRPQRNQFKEESLPIKRRITSGMLEIPEHSKIKNEEVKRQNGKVLEDENGDKENYGTHGMHDNDPSRKEISIVEKEQEESKKAFQSLPQEQRNNDLGTPVKSLSRDEILKLFKNGMRIPAKIRNRVHETQTDKNRQISALLKSLAIDMNDKIDFDSLEGITRFTRSSSKRQTQRNDFPPSLNLRQRKSLSKRVVDILPEELLQTSSNGSKDKFESIEHVANRNNEGVSRGATEKGNNVIDHSDLTKTSQGSDKENQSLKNATEYSDSLEVKNILKVEDANLDSLKNEKVDSFLSFTSMFHPSFKEFNTPSKLDDIYRQVKQIHDKKASLDCLTVKKPARTRKSSQEFSNVNQVERDGNGSDPQKPNLSCGTDGIAVENSMENRHEKDIDFKSSVGVTPKKRDSHTDNTGGKDIKGAQMGKYEDLKVNGALGKAENGFRGPKDNDNEIINKLSSPVSSSSEESSSSSSDEYSDDASGSEVQRPHVAEDILNQKIASTLSHRKSNSVNAVARDNTANEPGNEQINNTVGKQPISSVRAVDNTENAHNDKVSKKETTSNVLENGPTLNTKKSLLTSLDDLASRGLPEVESINKRTLSSQDQKKPEKQSNIQVFDESDESSESDDSTSDSESSSDQKSDDSDSEDEEESSQKYLKIKDLKKKKLKKSNGGFSALLRDAKRM